ncbi:MAG: hypothetical protein HOE53_00505 [Candidatus Magasanikbacteria bacterium]|jgi:hypothetical protein|nr:hypothetical protein [Candidatus Magasanikbacteria bacterium]
MDLKDLQEALKKPEGERDDAVCGVLLLIFPGHYDPDKFEQAMEALEEAGYAEKHHPLDVEGSLARIQLFIWNTRRKILREREPWKNLNM